MMYVIRSKASIVLITSLKYLLLLDLTRNEKYEEKFNFQINQLQKQTKALIVDEIVLVKVNIKIKKLRILR